MSRFSGKQFKGAKRADRLAKRKEAEKRQSCHDDRMKALLGVLLPAGMEVEFTENQERMVPVAVKKKRVRRKKTDAS
jgi:hypothetical protein